MSTIRLYKPRLFALLGKNDITRPHALADTEFEQLINRLHIEKQAIVSGQPVYLFVSLTDPVIAELVGTYMDTRYTMISGWAQLRTWSDYVRFVRLRWLM